MKIGAAVGLVASLLAAATGHKSGMDVAAVQPMKLAAMEALYNGGTDQGLTAVAWVNPFKQPDYANEQEPPLKIEMPYALSLMATNDPHGYVPGINDILNGYTTPDGKTEPPIDEKIKRGKQAITALAAYRQAKFNSSDDGSTAAYQLSILKQNIQYFGYGYIKDKNDIVPYIPINFWAFRIMVGAGCLFILFFAAILAAAYRWPRFLFAKRDITALPSWHYWLAIALIPARCRDQYPAQANQEGSRVFTLKHDNYDIRIFTTLLVFHRITAWRTPGIPALRAGRQFRSPFTGTD